MEWLSDDLGIKKMEDWTNITAEMIREKGGSELLDLFEGLPCKILESVYPEYHWPKWKFSEVPKGLWNDHSNCKRFFDWLGNKLGLKEPIEWYGVSLEVIKSYGGSGLLKKYGSLSQALKSVYPQHHWLTWKFHISKDNWNNKDIQRDFFDWLAKELGVNNLEDWYNVSIFTIRSYGGDEVMNIYHGSQVDVLKNIYPDHNWKPWKFLHSPKGFFNSRDNLYDFVDWLRNQLQLSTLEDWYRVSLRQIDKHSHSTIFRLRGFSSILPEVYPDHKWDLKKLERVHLPIKATQRYLVTLIRELFPTSEVYEEYESEELKFKSGRKIRIDVFLPLQNLALEYHGEQHYYDIFAMGPQWRFVVRDEEKRFICSRRGITVIEVPYWWDNELESLKAVIHQHRPDLIPIATGIPIPDKPPIKLQKNRTIEL